MDNIKKLEILEKQIDKMVKTINELNNENSKLREDIALLRSREKDLVDKLKEKQDFKKNRDIILKRLEKISKIIDKEIEG